VIGAAGAQLCSRVHAGDARTARNSDTLAAWDTPLDRRDHLSRGRSDTTLGLAQSAADYAPRTATGSSADHHRPRPIQERGSLMAVDVWKVKVGDQVREIGSTHALTVWRIDPPGSAGRAHGHGPSINANVRPGGYGVSFDNLTAHQFEEA
jgi:hypothetical protein